MKKAIFHDKGILKFRGVQLDLGRQMESLDYIRSFMDFAGCYGYNCLVLYLEGRIRTKSFPYKSKESSYSPDDIKNIVEYAGKKSMEVVPVVPMFGHADLFLDCPELAHLAELRGGITGRFSTYNHVFCPSLKETHEFLDHYITEVSALFPSEYFHAGFDEAWDIGYCDLCKKRLETETQSDIFTKHLLDCHAILSEKLKKKMIIWDDLFDIYPRALDQLPKDIIMCSWHYDKLVGRPAGHCGGPQTDKFAHYDKLGFSYLFAPAAFSIRNVESLSAYALNRRPLGGLLTIWELTRDFLFSDYPTIAYAGAAWSGNSANIPDAELQDNAVRETTGCGKKEQISLIKTILNSRDIMFLDKQQAYLRGPLSNEEYERKYFIDVAKASLKSYSSNASGQLQRDVLEDLAIGVEVESIYFELRELISALYLTMNSGREKDDLRKSVEHCVDRLKSVKAKRRQQWNRHRKGVTPCQTDLYFDSLIKMLSRTPEDAKKTRALLKATFPFDAPNIEFFIRYQNDREWHKVASGSFGQSPFIGSFYYYFPLCTDEIPEAVRIETWGYVGLGISFLEVETKKARFVPASIGAIEGNVNNPESLLEEGRDWCFIGEGEQCARRKYLNPCLAKIRNAMEVNLKKEEF